MKQVLMVGGVVVRIYLDHDVDDFVRMLLFTVCTLIRIPGIYVTSPPLRTHPLTVIQGFCADAYGSTRKCCWWVLLLYVPSNHPLTHKPIPTQPRFKVSALTRIDQR